MPEVFNFTARATAASGAFADRDFSITVSNTQINRLLAVSPSGVARALNSTSPWVLVPGVRGDSAAYGDRWLIWEQAAGILWTSPDAINFTNFVPTLPAGYSRLGFLRWRDGAWWAVASADRSSQWEHAVATSVDGGVTWGLIGATITDPSLVFSFERSEAGESILATAMEWRFRSDDGDAWSIAKAFNSFGYRFQIAHLNGMWFGPDTMLPNSLMARSVDGVGWFSQTNSTALISGGYYRGMAYSNGHLVACGYTEAVTGYSTDAALTVQTGAALPAACNSYDTECPIVGEQGRFVMIGDTGRTFAATTPAGPWTASSLPGGMTPLSLAVRP